MLEYYIIDCSSGYMDAITAQLNGLAKNGWRAVCMNESMIVMEREISPRIEETKTETERILTYSFPL